MFDRRTTRRSVRARGLALAAGLASTLGASRAHALEPRTTRLRYVVHAPVDVCPDEASFRSLVVARLGRDPFVPTGDDEMTITVDATTKAVQGRLVIVSGGRKPAERRFSERASACEPLIEAVATAAALALDPLGDGNAAAGLPAPPAPTAPPPPPPPATTTTTTTDTGSAEVMAPPATNERREPAPEGHAEGGSHLRFEARAGAVVGIGLAPGTTAGGDVAVGFARGAFSIFLEGRAETQVTDARGTSGDAIEATLFGAGLAPCGRLGVLMGCLVGRVGVIQGSAPALESGNLGSSVHAALGPRLGVWVPLGRGLAFTAAAEVVVPLVRTTFYIGGAPTWVASPIAGGFVLGLGFSGP